MYVQTGNDTLAEFGVKYQFRLLYYTCSLADFGREILPHLTSDMFDQEHFKQLVTLIRAYWQKYGQLPNVDNLRLMLRDELYMSPVQKEIVEGEINKFNQLRSMLASGAAHNDSQFVIEKVWEFVRDRSMRAVKHEMDSMLLTRSYENARGVMTRFQTAMQLGVKEHVPTTPARDMHDIWLNRYPNAVPTGIAEFDHILPGGLPPGKLGLILGGQGVGKSSLLTLLADNAWSLGYHVLHVVFDENDPDTEVTPKYQAKWSGIPVDEMRDNIPHMEKVVKEINMKREGKGAVSIMRFDSADTTVRVLKTWIQQYEERYGVHFDLIVLDYIDEVVAENRNYSGNQTAGEVEVVKAFHSMLVELKRPGWTATQAKKESNIKRLLYYDDCGGSIAKLKKAQVVITVGADPQQKHDNQVNVVFLKSNISKCGHIWEDCHFNRDTLQLTMGTSAGYAPAEEISKAYEEGEKGPITSSPPRPVQRAEPAPAPPAPVQTASTWRGSLPASDFEREGPALRPLAEQTPAVALAEIPGPRSAAAPEATPQLTPDWPPLEVDVSAVSKAGDAAYSPVDSPLVGQITELADMLDEA
jgi:hypothetical protein